jgi:hypothetical protein
MMCVAAYLFYEDFLDHVHYLWFRRSMEDTRTNALRMEASVAATVSTPLSPSLGAIRRTSQ